MRAPGGRNAVRDYVNLSIEIQESVKWTRAYFISAIFINLGFATWGFIIYATREGSCERPLSALFLATATSLAVSLVLTCLVFFLVDRIYSQVAHAGTSLSDPQLAVTYQRLPEDIEAAMRQSDVELKPNTAVIANSLSFLCVGFTCLLFGFIFAAVALFTALVWVLAEKNDCSTKAPELYDAGRHYAIGLCVYVLLLSIWNVFAFRTCPRFIDLHNKQHMLSAFVSQRQLIAPRSKAA